MLRVAEQQLKSGNIRQTLRLLHRIESEFPEQKLEGLYRYLRGEADRSAGLYEQAIRHYEVLMQLKQWASYRPNALYGIADSFYRMGSYDKALQWLTTLDDSFPAFYADRKLGDYRAVIEGRVKRLADAAEAAKTNAALASAATEFKGFQTGFETDEPPSAGMQYRFLPSLGFDGPRTLFIDHATDGGSQRYVRVLPNVVSEGLYWVEFWAKNTGTPPQALVGTQFGVWLGNVALSSPEQQTLLPDRTFGEWEKFGALLKAPVAQDAAVALVFADCRSLTEIDGFRILPVSDRQKQALLDFLEGADPQ